MTDFCVSVKVLVMVGDQVQLPPFVASIEERPDGFTDEKGHLGCILS